MSHEETKPVTPKADTDEDLTPEEQERTRDPSVPAERVLEHAV